VDLLSAKHRIVSFTGVRRLDIGLFCHIKPWFYVAGQSTNWQRQLI